jgi:hypothetical protein
MTRSTLVQRAPVELTLPPVPEPPALKQDLRNFAADAPALATDRIVEELVATLWEQWGSTLEHVRISRDTFAAVLRAHERELWYWVWGNRPWTHVIESVVGRLRRRLNAPTDRRT